MTTSLTASRLPPPVPQPFHGAISHPDLYLWDAWSYAEAGTLHLYCLAVERNRYDGTPLPPNERNNAPFHIRHFASPDHGESWSDEGCLLATRSGQGLADSRTVWSGSMTPLPDGQKLLAYTGLYERDVDHCFAQALMLALTDGYAVTDRPEAPLLCPLRDRELIVAAGYYLAALDDIGNREGEGGGPVMAWRDPFAFIDDQNRIHLFWSAKTAPCEGALGHALLRREGNDFRLDSLLPPTLLPDGERFTQFELPKVYHDAPNGQFYLLASTCNRTDERQRDEEVDKRLRLYRSDSLDGPWLPWSPQGSVLPGLDCLFGMTVLKADFDRRSLLCMAPYTDAAGPDLGLTFSPSFRIYLDSVKVVV
jgi:hypothetical protein